MSRSFPAAIEAAIAELQTRDPFALIGADYDTDESLRDAIHAMTAEQYPDFASDTLAQLGARMWPRLYAGGLIDPEARKVRAVLHTGRFGGPGGLYDLLGCDTIELFTLPDGSCLWVDENGLDGELQHGFVMDSGHPIIGRGIVTGDEAAMPPGPFAAADAEPVYEIQGLDKDTIAAARIHAWMSPHPWSGSAEPAEPAEIPEHAFAP